MTGGGTFSWPGHKIFEYDFQLKQLHEEDEAACHFFKSHFFSPSRNKRDKFYETSSLFFSKVSKETYQRCLFNQCRVLCSRCALDDYLIV